MQTEHSIRLLEPWMCLPCADIAQTAPDPWGLSDFETLPQKPHNPCWVLLSNNVVVGFACFLTVLDTADLQLVAVAPSHRGKGCARLLLDASFENLQKCGTKKVLLELRHSNTSAMNLYMRLGFQVLAKRRGMYRNPMEDGLLMVKEL